MRAIRARILHVESTQPLRWQHLKDGVVVIEAGKIKETAAADQLQRDGFDLDTCEDRRDGL